MMLTKEYEMQSIKFRSQIISMIAEAMCSQQKTESLRNYMYDRIYDKLQMESDDTLVSLLKELVGDEYEYRPVSRG